MRTWLRALVALLVALPLSGCLSFLDDDDGPDREANPASGVDDPSQIKITGVRIHNDPLEPQSTATIEGFGGTPLSYVVYEPLAQDALPGGQPPTFPVVVFLHGFGLTKEMWTCTPFGEPAQPPLPDEKCPFTDLLDTFARAGFISVAYDARGFGRSGGQVTVAGPAEMADLSAVIDWVSERFPVNGKVGVTGISYGGGQSLLGWGTDARITTAVAHQGWLDLYEALAPGSVPKGEWASLLVGEGTIASGGMMHPMVYGWAQAVVTRDGLDNVRGDLDARSPERFMAGTDKPLMLCAAMQDTLFTQVDELWQATSAFTRVIVHDGGHGTLDEECWEKTRQWFSFFLRGVDTKVDGWPFLQSSDAGGGHAVMYPKAPKQATQSYFLREPELTSYAGSNMTFTIDNRFVNNPLAEPSAIWDQAGVGNQAMPYSMRQDPSAVFFERSIDDDSLVILGSPRLQLVTQATTARWQVTGQLIHVDAEGNSRILARGAVANIPGETPAIEGSVMMDFSYTKATIDPGSMLVLKLGANDTSWFLPDPQAGTVAFSGHSELTLPLFVG